MSDKRDLLILGGGLVGMTLALADVDRNGTIESMQRKLRELADSLERRP